MTRTLPRILLLAALLGAAAFAATRWGEAEAWLRDAGPAGLGAFLAAFVALTMGCFPVSVLGFTAGAVFGPLRAFLLVVPGVVAAATLMFLLGRSLLREPIRRRLRRHPRGRALEDLAAAKALRLNVLARLSPFNFGFVCYTLAAGRTPLRTYVLGLVGTLPSLAAHVLVGALVRSGGAALRGEGAGSRLQLVVTAAAVAALLLLAWQVGRIARAAWREGAAAGAAESEEPREP